MSESLKKFFPVKQEFLNQFTERADAVKAQLNNLKDLLEGAASAHDGPEGRRKYMEARAKFEGQKAKEKEKK